MRVVHRAAITLGLLVTSTVAHATDLWILTRDGVLHQLESGAEKKGVTYEKPHGIASLATGQLVVAHADKLLVGGKPLPGWWGDLREIATNGNRLYATTDKSEIVRIDPQSGRRTSLGTVARCRLISVEDYQTWVAHDDQIESVGQKPSGKPIKMSSTVIALTSSGGMTWVITKDGKLWQVSGGQVKELTAFGNWWATLAFTSDRTGGLYLATQPGKLWRLDLSSGAKEALAMDGWQNAYGLAVAK
jgi:hypothetical protein